MTTPDTQRDAGSGVAPVELVLFDLSGVLLHFRGAEQLQMWTGVPTESEAWAKWLASEWMRRFDAGLCSPQEFAAGMIREWELELDTGEFLEMFTRWLVGPYDGAEELIARTRERVAVGCLSNMSVIHWDDEIAHWPLIAQMEPRFVSCHLGLTKPDPAIFEHVINAIVPRPHAVLFLDDNLINVEAGRAAGFQTAHVRGVGEAEAALRAYGLLD